MGIGLVPHEQFFKSTSNTWWLRFVNWNNANWRYYAMSYHVTKYNIMLHNVIPSYTMSYHFVQWHPTFYTMSKHFTPYPAIFHGFNWIIPNFLNLTLCKSCSIVHNFWSLLGHYPVCKIIIKLCISYSWQGSSQHLQGAGYRTLNQKWFEVAEILENENSSKSVFLNQKSWKIGWLDPWLWHWYSSCCKDI